MEEWILFVFKRGFHYYLVNGENETDAWVQLQRKLSWNMDIIKRECTLINVMSSTSPDIIKL